MTWLAPPPIRRSCCSSSCDRPKRRRPRAADGRGGLVTTLGAPGEPRGATAPGPEPKGLRALRPPASPCPSMRCCAVALLTATREPHLASTKGQRRRGPRPAR
jgi:hypothetical protein